MASHNPEVYGHLQPDVEDVHMNAEDEDGEGEEEGEGHDVAMKNLDDSSEEESEDEEEERRVRDGFIVDEDEEEEEDDEEAEKERRRRRKRRKRHHRRREEDEQLEEDDLELLEENTGTSHKNRLRRLRRGRESESPPAASSSKRRTVVESSDEDLDRDDDRPRTSGIHDLWDDDKRGEDEDDGMDTDSFIEYSDDEEGGQEGKEERRRAQKQDAERRRRARGARPELAGIDMNAWDELHDVFGDGEDYNWALELDEDEQDLATSKNDMRYQDVFEPSEIRRRLLTADDDRIRAKDTPERFQLATSSLSKSSTLALHPPMSEDDLGDAALWVTPRLPRRKSAQFFSGDGEFAHLGGQLVMAVTYVLRCLFVEQYEVPFIWVHRRDYISHFDIANPKNHTQLLDLPELWLILALGEKYRSLLQRRRTLASLYERLGRTDEYFDLDIMPQADSIEFVADSTEWLTMKYKEKEKDSFAAFRFHDDEEQPAEVKKPKMPSRISAYEVAKKSVISKLAAGFGLESHQVAQNYFSPGAVNRHYVEDPELNPIAFAEQFADPDPSKAQPAEDLLARARMILATEIGKDPLLRREIRKLFQDEGLVTIEPTERGVTKIDDHHPYYNFKYLFRKKVKDMLDSSQFLLILAAEAEHLVTVQVYLPPATVQIFEKRLSDAFSSDSFSDSANLWNAERARVVAEATEQHLIPVGVKWAREYVRDEVEDLLAQRCSEQLRKRVDVAPYLRRPLGEGEYASSVLALSWGKGDPHKDAITLVFLDSAGRLRAQTKIDNLYDQEMLDEFYDLISQKKPDVIVVGGFSMATLKLTARVKEVLLSHAADPDGRVVRPDFQIPVQYVQDDVARIYQHSDRAAEEFSSLSPIAKYCVGLARYIQNPLNEFAALGPDISAIMFKEEDQHLIPREKLLRALESVLVDVTNNVGVNINRAVSDPYYQHLLPFICGLGPRKAQALVSKIAASGGNLINRTQFVKNQLLTMKLFLNASGFLRITQYRNEHRLDKHRHDDELPDPLDDTRVALEDYDLARKMATDALELDEEDVHDEHASHVVNLIMADPDKERKLMELNLDEFAISMYQANAEQKRHTLTLIREELLRPFADRRPMYQVPDSWQVLTMLSGETQRTLRVGVIVSAIVQRISSSCVNVKMDSGIEGMIIAEYLADTPDAPKNLVKKGQTVTGVIIDIKNSIEEGIVQVELSTRKNEVHDGDSQFRSVSHDDYWDHSREDKDKDALARKKRSQNQTHRRVIKHPNFHNFTSSQAEAYLENQQRGDVVIRPSSRGLDHLAVTWKVDDGLYQHLDVVEKDPDPTGQGVGGQLMVDNKVYADLDELIVTHVAGMARKVEDLMSHEKFKAGPEEELHIFLKNFLAANPSKSMYGFTLNRKRPGHFNLCFLANKNSTVQTWPVRVTPDAYFLIDSPAVGVSELCDAFKVRYLHESNTRAQKSAAHNGGKTPYGRTPARPMGGATPGHASVRHTARTPNPYGYGTSSVQGRPPPPPPPGVPSRPIHQGWGAPSGQW